MPEEGKGVPIDFERIIAAVRDFSPERLTLAREMAGIEIKQIAKRIDTTPSAVSQFESGRAKPKAETLIRLALALGVPPEFFAGPALPAIEMEACFFRSLKSATQMERRRVLAYGKLVKHVADYLGERVNFPAEQISSLCRRVTSRAQIEELALAIRDAWNLGQGPISNMVALLEDRGVLPIEVPGHSERLDAFSVWIEAKPVVFLTVEKGAATRRRWDCAHELGHLLLHDPTARESGIDVEQEADAFASAFLLPAVPFMAECPRRLDWNRLRALKRRWGVSLAAIVRRAFDLKIFTEATYRRAYTTLNQIGWRKHEPDEPALERPALLQRALRLLRDAGHTLSRVASDLGLGEGRLSELLAPHEPEQIAFA